jgi:hypothetical protein
MVRFFARWIGSAQFGLAFDEISVVLTMLCACVTSA